MVIFIIVLLLLGLFFIFLELFVPGGIVGSIGAILMGTAIIMCFYHYGPSTGIAVFLGSCVVSVIAIVLFIKLFPHTAEGKWIIMSNTLVKAKGSHSDTAAHESLIGVEGISESELRPVGIATVNGQRLDVMTEGDFVEPNTPVRVLRVDGNRIVVERSA